MGDLESVPARLLNLAAIPHVVDLSVGYDRGGVPALLKILLMAGWFHPFARCLSEV